MKALQFHPRSKENIGTSVMEIKAVVEVLMVVNGGGAVGKDGDDGNTCVTPIVVEKIIGVDGGGAMGENYIIHLLVFQISNILDREERNRPSYFSYYRLSPNNSSTTTLPISNSFMHGSGYQHCTDLHNGDCRSARQKTTYHRDGRVVPSRDHCNDGGWQRRLCKLLEEVVVVCV
ncbi:Uncharacterized protein Fot_31997 [Forsythia ovata]|uniref:Uncharacterized protein n=1 Tax=Forsythia ovata TaxID=205694 RepID=A0ABD1T6J2_9LAMI